MKLKYLIILIAVYVMFFFLLFPYYRYLIDPDATGYIKVAERLAKGDYFNAINGLWSPLGSWILTPFIKLGFDPVLTAKYLNGVYGLVILCAFFFLLKKINIAYAAAISISLAAIALILHFVFLRLFGDLLQAVFLLLYLNVICSKGFYESYKKIILAALLGGLGFYAKAYSFYFTLAHLATVLIVLEKRKNNHYFTIGGLKKIAAAITVLIISVLPWAFILKQKYGALMLSRTGQYNMTWSLSQVYAQPRVLFYPPPYPDGYSLWDDLSYWHVTNITPFTSSRIFLFQIKLFFSNTIEALNSFNAYSCFFIAIISFAAVLLITKAKGFKENSSNLFLVTFIAIWVLGILLLHVEPRFLWITALLALLLAGAVLTYLNTREYINKKMLFYVSLIIALSFCLFPLTDLKNQIGAGKNIYAMADVLKHNNIGGNLISYHRDSHEMSDFVVLNYLLKGRYYGPFENDYSDNEILKGIDEYKIDNYILFYHSDIQKKEILNGIIASKADGIKPDLFPGMIVLSFKH